MTEATIEAAAKADVIEAKTWLQKHERIILVFLILVAGSWFGNHWLNNTAAKDKLVATATAQQLNDQKDKNAQLSSQVATTAAQYQAMVSSLTQQNAQLASAMSNRTVVLKQQQTVDKTLPLPDLGDRWTTLAGLQPGDLTATQNGITVTDEGARATVTQLEQIPVLTQNLADSQTQVKDGLEELNKADSLIDGLDTQVSGLNVQITDQQTADAAALRSAKASARKSKLGWFLKGIGVGAVAVGYIALHL